VDIVYDETDVEMYWINTEDPQSFYNGSFQSHTHEFLIWGNLFLF
jgi:hypothetical protein